MRLFNPFRVLFFLLFLSFSFNLQAQQTGFSENQKTLLREALRVAVSTEKNLPEYEALPNKKKIYLLDKMVFLDNTEAPLIYLSKDLVPEFKNVKFKLVSEEAMQKKDSKNDILFIRLAQIPEPESDFAVVHVLTQWKLGKASRQKGFKHKEGSGYTMLFQKNGPDWKFQKVINRFINFLDTKK